MAKRNIYFCPDIKTFEYLCGTMSGIPSASYTETENYINDERAQNIITMSMAHFSYELKDYDRFNIFLCHGKNVVPITYDSCPEPTLIGYNLLDGFKRGDFDSILGLKTKHEN